MIATLISVLISAWLYYSTLGSQATPNANAMASVLIVVATLMLFLPVLATTLIWSPLQQAEQRLTPRITDLFRKDFRLGVANAIMMLFAFISYASSIDFLFSGVLNKHLFLPLWLIFFGVSLDTLHYALKRIPAYLDPQFAVSEFSHEAERCVQEEREMELCQWIDSLSEVAIRAIQRSSLSLCNQICDELQKITRNFLHSSKSYGRQGEDRETKALGIQDKVSYTLFFILQRLEMIDLKAVEQRLEPVCSQLVNTAAKIVIASAQYDMSIAAYPLGFVGKFARNAQDNGIAEVGPKAICTFLEVARSLLTDIDVTYLELQDPFSTLIAQMNEISKEEFRQDKNISVKLLAQPFRELKELFTTAKMASHPDTPAILQMIDRILGEYDALETVMRTIPTIPETNA